MKKFAPHLCLLILILLPFNLMAQVEITGKVTDKDGKPLAGADVFLKSTNFSTQTNREGKYLLTAIPHGQYTLAAFSMGKAIIAKEINMKEHVSGLVVDFELAEAVTELESVIIKTKKEKTEGISRLNAVEGFGIYEAKKSEVVILGDLVANKASNNARQIFAKVPGLNIWESDCAGLQIGVGGRGLSPDRNSNFNTRQNGYDISADALGYPESYYSPALQAVDRVEIVRGAASLQYGTQFGGLVNFVLKKGPADKKLEFNSEQTGNSLGFYSGFNSVGGTVGKVNYYAYNRYSTGECWRCNSEFKSNTTYINTNIAISDRFNIAVDYTNMYYLAQQPGGLTDALFQADPRQSIRNRNWFRVNWNLFALAINYQISEVLKMNIRNFGLVGGRDALGNLGRIDRADHSGARNLFVDKFNNFGSEARFIYNYNLAGQPTVLLVGGRYYRGNTDRSQGNGSANGIDFNFTNPEKLENSDYTFPGQNTSIFAENIFNITNRLSITPGVRFEAIETEAEGYYTESVLVPDPETGLASDSSFQTEEYKRRDRSFLFFGIGASFKYSERMEFYANFSENYRAINFNDIRVENPNLVVDEDIRDERGYNADFGIRGGKAGFFNYDVSLFYLRYSGKIGAMLVVDEETFRIYRFRTNVSDSRNIGIEAFGEVNFNKLLQLDKIESINVFVNLSAIDARYVGSNESSISNKKVELVPPLSIKTGVNFSTKRLKLAYQFSYTQEHFTDATNAKLTASAVEGTIPSYAIMDLSGAFTINANWGIEAGVNNLTNNYYFTRRASGYPGPGIIPSDGRSFYLTAKFKL